MRADSKNRPKWADILRFWLTDGQYDRLDEVDAADWRWTWRGPTCRRG